VCSLALSRALLPDVASHKLSSLKDQIGFTMSPKEVEICGVSSVDHRAIYDVMVLVQLWRYLQEGSVAARADAEKFCTTDDAPIDSEALVDVEREVEEPIYTGIPAAHRMQETEPVASSSSVASSVRLFSALRISPSSIKFPSGELVIEESRRIPGVIPVVEPSWWESYAGFHNGDALSAVWENHSRHLMLSTVIQHIIKAYLNGEAVDLERLAEEATSLQMGPPSKSQFQAFEVGAAKVVASSYLEPFPSKYVLLESLDADAKRLVQADTSEKLKLLSTEDKLEKARWYVRLAWWRLIKYSLVDFSFSELG
jgi:hypothetical protein